VLPGRDVPTKRVLIERLVVTWLYHLQDLAELN
jgi:hypothetical protein